MLHQINWYLVAVDALAFLVAACWEVQQCAQ